MSRKSCRREYGTNPYEYSLYGANPYGTSVAGAGYSGSYSCGCGSTYGGCNFACFIILILILLVFTNNKRNDCYEGDGGILGYEGTGKIGGIDKGILFIITLYFLSCWVPCARGTAY